MSLVDKDICQFVAAVGGKMPLPEDGDIYWKWKSLFKRPNYFFFDGKFMIVKISRSQKPFWGVGKKYIDLLDKNDDYFLVLLCSPNEGWMFVKSEINAHIRNNSWKLREKDNQYKINSPLPDKNSFASPEDFLRRWGAHQSG